MRSGLKTLFAITLASCLASCAGKNTITVPNYEFYGDKGKYGATKVESLHPEKPGVRIPKSEWDEIRIGMVCTKGTNITDMQANIDKLCAKNSFACSYVKDSLEKFQAALSLIESAAETKKEDLDGKPKAH